MLRIHSLTLGPVRTNTYLLADSEKSQAVVIDPAWDGSKIAAAALAAGWKITAMWLTHAHFDHIGGVAELQAALPAPVPVYLHPAEEALWKGGGGGALFGYRIRTDLATTPLRNGDLLFAGAYVFRVIHTPGHRPGHCVFYCAEENILFSGDLIFYRSVGRTDLPEGDQTALERSILEKIYTLPANTRLLPGHGEATSVGEEREENPFVRRG